MRTDEAIRAWAESTTQRGSAEREKIIRHKCGVVREFFQHAGVSPERTGTAHVRAWRTHLEKRLSKKTVYDRLTYLSTFFASLGGRNPVQNARPDKPRDIDKRKPAATVEYLQKLLAEMRRAASTGDLSTKRDLAMLLMYAAIPIRRAVLCELSTKDVQMDGHSVVVTYPARVMTGHRRKGLRTITARVEDPELRDALADYLKGANRLLQQRGPLWTRHDHKRQGRESLKPEAFVHNIKRHAASAGIEILQLNQFRGINRKVKQSKS